MNQFARSVGVSLFIVLFLFSSLAATAEEITVESAAVSFQTVDGERVATFLNFTAQTAEFTLSSPRGRYNETTEMMTASGSVDRRAILTKAGDTPFEVSATSEIGINFGNETLAAIGDVIFRSEELDARSDELFVDRRAALEARINALMSTVTLQETLQLIESFLAKVDSGDRLILFSGNVRVVREDTTMESAWMLVNEADQSEFISIAAPNRSLTLTIVNQDGDEVEAESQE